MAQVINIILPVFALIALGFIMVKRGLFSQAGVNDLVRFIFYLAVPSLLFRTSASGVMNQPLEFEILIAFYGTGLILFFALYFFLKKIGHELSVVAAMSGTFCNLALIGLPIIQTAFPHDAIVPLMTIITFNAMILFTLPCILIEGGRNPQANVLRIMVNGVMSAVKNPLVIALVSGWVAATLGWELPSALDRLTEFLAKAAAPCALFAVGGGMARYSLKLEETTLPVLCVTVAKLLIMPVSVWLLCHYVLQTSALWTMIATFGAAMPTGANPFVLATKYQVGDRIAGNSILLTTSLSVITLSLFLLLFPTP